MGGYALLEGKLILEPPLKWKLVLKHLFSFYFQVECKLLCVNQKDNLSKQWSLSIYCVTNNAYIT